MQSPKMNHKQRRSGINIPLWKINGLRFYFRVQKSFYSFILLTDCVFSLSPIKKPSPRFFLYKILIRFKIPQTGVNIILLQRFHNSLGIRKLFTQRIKRSMRFPKFTHYANSRRYLTFTAFGTISKTAIATRDSVSNNWNIVFLLPGNPPPFCLFLFE